MNAKQKIEDYLIKLKKSTVSLEELESVCSGFSCGYEDFSMIILDLEATDVLQIVKTKGRTGKNPSLAYQYRVNKSKLKLDLHKEIQIAQLHLDRNINLNTYYKLSSKEWLRDLPYIERINRYLNQHLLPSEPVAAPERSLALVGDEKWITEGGGEELLGRIGLWSKMKILSVADPLMLAINPRELNKGNGTIHRHLIVENKTTFQILLQALPEVPFTSLIYGCGKKIVRSIEGFPFQIPLHEAEHQFYYFGDIDHEGINIWFALNDRMNHLFQTGASPAVPFYLACLEKSYVYGKETHRKDENALSAFLSHFDESAKQRILSCLSAGGYYPQEILKSVELGQLWGSNLWNI